MAAEEKETEAAMSGVTWIPCGRRTSAGEEFFRQPGRTSVVSAAGCGGACWRGVIVLQ